MQKTLLSLVVCLMVASTAPAQITGPASATFKLNQKNASVVITLTVDIEDAQYEVLSDTLEVFREFESVSAAKTRLRVRINTSQAGSGYVVVAALRGGKLEPLFKCHVSVGDSPGPTPPAPPPPGPTPPPVPPPAPVDPQVKALQDAAAKDGWPKSKLSDLAAGFTACAGLTSRGETCGDLETATSTALKAAVTTIPANTKAILAGELRALNAALSDPAAPLSDINREMAKGVFLRLAKLCGDAAK